MDCVSGEIGKEISFIGAAPLAYQCVTTSRFGDILEIPEDSYQLVNKEQIII